MAHEYTHAVTFSAKALAGRPGRPPAPEEEGWLDEALAHLVEDLHGFSRSNLDYRVSAFLSRPERYRLVVDDYYAADLFRSHGNRGGTYLFLRWCADRFGPALVPALIRSDRRGVANLEAATGAVVRRPLPGVVGRPLLRRARPGAAAGPGFRSVDVRGPFDGWDLAGPRTVSRRRRAAPSRRGRRPGRRAATWSSGRRPAGRPRSTSRRRPRPSCRSRPSPCPTTSPSSRCGSRAVAGPDGEPCLQVDLRERNGTPVRLSALAWEPLVPGPDPHAPGFRRAGLDAAGVAAAFGTVDAPGARPPALAADPGGGRPRRPGRAARRQGRRHRRPRPAGRGLGGGRG